MASITSTLRLNDMMTTVLKRINRAMSITIDSLEAVNRASGQAFDDQNILAARREIDLANRELNAMADHYNNIRRQATRSGSAVDGLTSKIKSMVGAALGMAGVKKAFDLSDTMTLTTARLKMVDDGGNVDALQQKIFASAQDSRGVYQATADRVAKLGLMAGEAFTSNNEIIAFAEQINKKFAIAGTEAAGMEAAWLQLTQAMGSGVLRGEEYNSILEQAPNIIQSIAKYLNVPKGKLKDMAAEGKITADIVKNAMFDTAKETNTQFDAMPKTFAQTFQSMKNQALIAFQPVLNKLNTILNSVKVQKFVSSATKGLATVGNVALNVLNAIAGVGAFVADNWSVIGPIIAVVTAAILAQKAALVAYNIIQGAATAITNAKAMADMLLAGHTTLATAAQSGFNAALWACPVTWIIAALLVLIAVFIFFTEEVMGTLFWWGALFKNAGLWVANLGLAAWAVIKNIGVWFKNLGMAAWAIIKNVGAWFGNLGMGIWAVLKACASNVATAFKNGWIDIQVGFWSMVDIIMQGIKKVAELANKCLGWMGVNIDTSGLDFAAKKVDELNKKKDTYKDIGEAWKEGFNTFAYNDVGDAMKTYEYNSVSDAFGTFETFGENWGGEAMAAGYDVGADLKKKMSGVVGEALSGFAGGSATDYLSEISANTGKMADCGDKTSEELAYLRDIAEQEAINRFTTAQVKVDFTSNNNISSDMDVDGMTERFTREFTAALETAAEGVY